MSLDNGVKARMLKQPKATGVAYQARRTLALNTIADYFGHQCHRVCEIISSKAPVTFDRIVKFSSDASFGRNSSLVSRGSRYVIGDGDGQILSMTREEVAKCLAILIHHGIVYSYCSDNTVPSSLSGKLNMADSIPLYEIEYNNAILWLHMPVYTMQVAQQVRKLHQGNAEVGNMAGYIVSHVSTGGSTHDQAFKFLNTHDADTFNLAWETIVNKKFIVPWKIGVEDYNDDNNVSNGNCITMNGVLMNNTSKAKNSGAIDLTDDNINNDSTYYMLDIRRINILLRHKVCLDYVISSKIGAKKQHISESIVQEVYKAFLKVALTTELDNSNFDIEGNLKWTHSVTVLETHAFQELDDDPPGVPSGFSWSAEKFKAAAAALCDMRPPALVQYSRTMYKVNMSDIVNQVKEELSQSIISHRYGDRSGRILRLLVELGHLDQKAISDMAMIPMHDTRYDLYQMLQQHVVELHEVPRPPNRTPATTLYFWSTSHKLIKAAAENFTFKSILNLKLRRQRFVAGDNMAIIEMADKYNECYKQLGSMNVTDIGINQAIRCARTMKIGKIIKINDVETKVKTVEIQWTENEDDHKKIGMETSPLVGNAHSNNNNKNQTGNGSATTVPAIPKYLGQEVVPLDSIEHYVHVTNSMRRQKLPPDDTNKLFRITVIRDRIDITIGRLQKTLMCLTHFNGIDQEPILYKRDYEKMTEAVEPSHGPSRKKKKR
jgi:hypothetical protein